MGDHRARALAIALGVFIWCARAAAFPTSRLTYARGNGAEACPEESTVRQAVATRLGYDPFFAAADKTIVARITRNRDELRATVELVDDHGIVRGVREFKARAGQCDELVATVALAISIAIDPTNPGISGDPPKPKPDPPRPPTKEQPKSAGPKPAPPPPTAPPPEDDTREVDQPEPPVARSTELRIGGAAIGALGTAPAPTVGIALSAGIRRDLWSLSLEGRSELPGTADSGGGQVRTSLWAGAIVPCLHFAPTVVCGTAWLGSLRAQGVGFPTSRTDHALYAATGLRFGIEVPLSEVWIFRPEIDVLASLLPVDLKVDGASHWAAPGLSALFRAGMVAHFP